MAQQTASNTFTQGMTTDISEMNMSSDTMTTALNATLSTFNGNEGILLNDMGNCKIRNKYNGNEEIAHFPKGYVPIGSIEFGGVIYYALVSKDTFEKDGKTLRHCQIGSFPSPDYSSKEGKLIYQYQPLKVGYSEVKSNILPVKVKRYHGVGIEVNEGSDIDETSYDSLDKQSILFDKPTQNDDGTILTGENYKYSRHRIDTNLSIADKISGGLAEGYFGDYCTFSQAKKLLVSNGDGLYWRLPTDEAEISEIFNSLLLTDITYSYDTKRKGMRYTTNYAEFMYVPYQGFQALDVSSTTLQSVLQTSGGTSQANSNYIHNIEDTDNNSDNDSNDDNDSNGGTSDASPRLLATATPVQRTAYKYYTDVSINKNDTGLVSLIYTENNASSEYGDDIYWTADGETIDGLTYQLEDDGTSVTFIAYYNSSATSNSISTISQIYNYSSPSTTTETTGTVTNNVTNNTTNTNVTNNNLSSASSNSEANSESSAESKVVSPETTGEYNENVNNTLTLNTLKYVNIGNYQDSFIGENCYIWALDGFMYRLSDCHKLKLATEKEGNFLKEKETDDTYYETYVNSSQEIIPIVTIDVVTSSTDATDNTGATASSEYIVKVQLLDNSFSLIGSADSKSKAETLKSNTITEYIEAKNSDSLTDELKTYKTTTQITTKEYRAEKYKAGVFLILDKGNDVKNSNSNIDVDSTVVNTTYSSCGYGKIVKATLSDSSIAVFSNGTTSFYGKSCGMTINAVSNGDCVLTIECDGETSSLTLHVIKNESEIFFITITNPESGKYLFKSNTNFYKYIFNSDTTAEYTTSLDDSGLLFDITTSGVLSINFYYEIDDTVSTITKTINVYAKET